MDDMLLAEVVGPQGIRRTRRIMKGRRGKWRTGPGGGEERQGGTEELKKEAAVISRACTGLCWPVWQCEFRAGGGRRVLAGGRV